MVFSSKNSSINFMQILENDQIITAVLEEDSEIKKDLATFQKEIATQLDFRTVSVVYVENIFVPFLTGKDNLLLAGKKMDKTNPDLLEEILQDLNVESRDLLEIPSKQLGIEEQVKLQLVRIIILQKKMVLMENILDHFSVLAIQNWLPLLKKIGQKYDIHFLLFTTQEAVAISHYCDRFIQGKTA